MSENRHRTVRIASAAIVNWKEAQQKAAVRRDGL